MVSAHHRRCVAQQSVLTKLLLANQTRSYSRDDFSFRDGGLSVFWVGPELSFSCLSTLSAGVTGVFYWGQDRDKESKLGFIEFWLEKLTWSDFSHDSIHGCVETTCVDLFFVGLTSLSDSSYVVNVGK